MPRVFIPKSNEEDQIAAMLLGAAVGSVFMGPAGAAIGANIAGGMADGAEGIEVKDDAMTRRMQQIKQTLAANEQINSDYWK